ncbi:uncharacterized protein K02A2.6-like [Haliotis rubra]|uniref:uncharacterized protein K02A2.6-like n=1 Tax=Haliotis rubra TaxID=36100 RepID=UPI001EE527BB|nr:uncharacterized protein K02A2.6-like [Haliotis rubra]
MSCRTCARSRPNSHEPLIPSEIPTRPWSKVSTDLFEINSSPYLLVIDYYSKYIEIAKLSSTTSACVVNHLKSIFGRHGIPDIVVSDNGPQYSSYTFKTFSEDYRFNHITSSPRYPQSNGEAERAVKTIKQTLKKATDPYLALLTYRSTPLQCGYSPAQLLMGRNLRTTLPVHPSQLEPHLPSSQEVDSSFKQSKQRQKSDYDSRHRSRNLPPVKEGDKVLVDDPEATREAEVYKKANTPRSYYVKSGDNLLRRNRKHLVLLPPQLQSTSHRSELLQSPVSTQPQSSSDIPPNSTVTRSGRVSTKPNRLDL